MSPVCVCGCHCQVMSVWTEKDTDSGQFVSTLLLPALLSVERLWRDWTKYNWFGQDVRLEEAREDCVLAGRSGAAELPGGLNWYLQAGWGWAGRRGAGLALVPGCSKEDMNRVTEPSFSGTALLHLFGFPQSKHYFLDTFNNQSFSHTPVFAFLLLHKNPPLPNLFCGWLVGKCPKFLQMATATVCKNQ